MMYRIALIVLALLFSTQANAHHHKQYRYSINTRLNAQQSVFSWFTPQATSQPQILPHPAGCPAHAFCGCGASIEVYGHSVRELWLASNWYKFPRSEPMPGAAMVRNHHVAILRQHIEGSI